MQLQFNKSELRFLDTAARGIRNTEVSQEIRLPEGMPDIGRVLTTWGQVMLRSKEWQDGTVTVTGGVKAWTLYAPEDGTEPRSVESWIPFQLRWEAEDVGREGPVRVLPLLRFADSRSISARKMMIRAGVGAMVQALYSKGTEVYEPVELPEDVQILKNSYPVRLHSEAGEKTFLLDEELMLQDSAGAEKLLSSTVFPEITEKRVLADKIVFKGTAHVHLVCRNSEGKVHSTDLEVPVSQFAELDGSYDGDTEADICMAVTSLETDLAEPGKLFIKCGMVAQYLIDQRKMLELVQDAYSPLRQVDLSEMLLELPVVLDERRETVAVEQTVAGQNGQVADAVFLPDFPRHNRHDGEVELEMHGLFRMLIYGEDGSLQGINSRWEGSRSVNAADNTNLTVSVQPVGRVQTMAGMDAMVISTQVMVRQQTGTGDSIPMVTGLELGQPREAGDARPSLVLCSCGMESLWDLAKRCNSTVDAICAANGLSAEPVHDRILLIPVK